MMGVAPSLIPTEEGDNMGLKRKLFVSGRSLYVNLPSQVISASGFKAGEMADVRYVEGIGVIVSLPIKFPLSMSERMRPSALTTGVKRSGRMMRSMDGEYLEVIPLYDGFHHPK
jgi:hypothetical protein